MQRQKPKPVTLSSEKLTDELQFPEVPSTESSAAVAEPLTPAAPLEPSAPPAETVEFYESASTAPVTWMEPQPASVTYMESAPGDNKFHDAARQKDPRILVSRIDDLFLSHTTQYSDYHSYSHDVDRDANAVTEANENGETPLWVAVNAGLIDNVHTLVEFYKKHKITMAPEALKPLLLLAVHHPLATQIMELFLDNLPGINTEQLNLCIREADKIQNNQLKTQLLHYALREKYPTIFSTPSQMRNVLKQSFTEFYNSALKNDPRGLCEKLIKITKDRVRYEQELIDLVTSSEDHPKHAAIASLSVAEAALLPLETLFKEAQTALTAAQTNYDQIKNSFFKNAEKVAALKALERAQVDLKDTQTARDQAKGDLQKAESILKSIQSSIRTDIDSIIRVLLLPKEAIPHAEFPRDLYYRLLEANTQVSYLMEEMTSLDRERSNKVKGNLQLFTEMFVDAVQIPERIEAYNQPAFHMQQSVFAYEFTKEEFENILKKLDSKPNSPILLNFFYMLSQDLPFAIAPQLDSVMRDKINQTVENTDIYKRNAAFLLLIKKELGLAFPPELNQVSKYIFYPGSSPADCIEHYKKALLKKTSAGSVAEQKINALFKQYKEPEALEDAVATIKKEQEANALKLKQEQDAQKRQQELEKQKAEGQRQQLAKQQRDTQLREDAQKRQQELEKQKAEDLRKQQEAQLKLKEAELMKREERLKQQEVALLKQKAAAASQPQPSSSFTSLFSSSSKAAAAKLISSSSQVETPPAIISATKGGNGSGSEYDYLFKLILVGDAGVGKSCLLLRFADDTYTDSHISTSGVDFKLTMLDMENKKIKLQTWDTRGDRFRSATEAPPYRGTHGIVVAFDLTDSKSFENVKQWLIKMDRYAPEKVVRILVGTKSDLSAKRAVDKEVATQFAKELGLTYIETSAKNGTHVDQVFIQLTHKICQQIDQKPSAKPSAPAPRKGW